jgi:glycosyltransferase involved in cell wall biosynthesis
MNNRTIVLFLSFVDEKKMIFYEGILERWNQSAIGARFLFMTYYPFRPRLPGHGNVDFHVVYSEVGFEDKEKTRKLLSEAAFILFDGFSFETFYEFLVQAARQGVPIGIKAPYAQVEGLGELREAGAVIDMGDSQEDLSRELEKIMTLAPERRKERWDRGRAAAEELFNSTYFPQKTQAREGNGTREGWAGAKTALVYFDSIQEHKNQRYYRHADHLRAKEKDPLICGLDFNRSEDWLARSADILRGREVSETGQNKGNYHLVGVPFNNLDTGSIGRWLPGLKHFLSSFFLFLELFRLADSKPIARFHAHSLWSGLAGVWLKRSGRVGQLIYHDLDYYPGFYSSNRLESRFLRKAERIVLRGSDVISSVSSPLVQLRRTQTSRPVFLSSNGVDLNLFNGEQRRKRETVNRIIYTGSLDRWSGMDRLVLAMPRILASVPDTELWILGSAWKDRFFTEEVQPLIDKNGLEDKVKFLGEKKYEELPQYLNQASLGIIPNRINRLRQYACPLKLYEYAACGLPIVVTRIGEMASIVEEEGLGAVASFEPDDLAEKIIGLLRDRDKWETCSDNAWRYARQKGWDTLFDQEEREIDQRLGAAGAPPPAEVPPPTLVRFWGLGMGLLSPAEVVGLPLILLKILIGRRLGEQFRKWNLVKKERLAYSYAYPPDRTTIEVKGTRYRIHFDGTDFSGSVFIFREKLDLGKKAGKITVRLSAQGEKKENLLFSLIDREGASASVPIFRYLRGTGKNGVSIFEIPVDAFPEEGAYFNGAGSFPKKFHFGNVNGVKLSFVDKYYAPSEKKRSVQLEKVGYRGTALQTAVVP